MISTALTPLEEMGGILQISAAMTQGDDFDLQPTLAGELLTLRPLQENDFEALYAVASDPLIWEQHPEPTRCERPIFERWFDLAMKSGGTLVAIDNRSGEMMGSSRYYEWDAAKREVAIGFTFLARSHWGGAANGEMKRLMLGHAFQWADRVWLHIGKDNLRSMKAAEKIGAIYSHEAAKEIAGTTRPYGYYFLSKSV
jgi:RimJ/RimL family protein N-acetyltransferase